MDDMLQETEAMPFMGDVPLAGMDLANALGKVLSEHKGGDVAVLDLRELNSWTDFFVIATVSSNTHLDGLERHVKDFCIEHDLEILRRSHKPRAIAAKNSADDEWRLIDMGTVVVHLMSERARSFYELERLWQQTKAPRQAAAE